MALGLFLAACSSDIAPRGNQSHGEPVRFGPEVSLGTSAANAASPLLRFAPDGRLFAIWTEDETGQTTKSSSPSAHHQSGKWRPRQCAKPYWLHRRTAAKLGRAAKRVKQRERSDQGEENGPKIAFSADNRAYIVWSIPGEKVTRRGPMFALQWMTAKAASPPRVLSTK